MKIGYVVQSNYRARWYGTVVGLNVFNNSNIVTVKIEYDSAGRKQRKPKLMNLSVYWLRIVNLENPYQSLNW